MDRQAAPSTISPAPSTPSIPQSTYATLTPSPPQPPQTRSNTAANKRIATKLRCATQAYLFSEKDHPYLVDFSAHNNNADSTPADPRTHKTAMKSLFAEEWRKAELEEFASLVDRDVCMDPCSPSRSRKCNILQMGLQDQRRCKWQRRQTQGPTRARFHPNWGNRLRGDLCANCKTRYNSSHHQPDSLATSLNLPMEQDDIHTIFLCSDI